MTSAVSTGPISPSHRLFYRWEYDRRKLVIYGRIVHYFVFNDHDCVACATPSIAQRKDFTIIAHIPYRD